MHPIAITNVAIVTPLTQTGVSTWEALRAGQRVDRPSVVDEQLLAALAKALPDRACRAVGDREIDKSIRLAVLTAALALGGGPHDAALFCGTSKGPVYTMLAALHQLHSGSPISPRQAEQIILGPAAMGPIAQESLALRGRGGGGVEDGRGMHTSVAACSSGMHALHRAARAIDSGECDRALVVAADASVHPLFEGSFQRLGVLAPLEPDGSRRCEPFGPAGRGFFLTEAAAAILLERSPKTDPLAWLEDVRIAADGTHLIAVDARSESLGRMLRREAGEAGAGAPAFVHAHATGTQHDAYELAAIRAALGEVPVFSHKARLGHTLGAAGLVSVAISALSHADAHTYDGRPVPPGARSLTIAQGFGGHIAIARLRSVLPNDPAT